MQRRVQISNNIPGILQTDAQAHQVRVHAGFPQLLVAELAVGVRGRVQDARIAVGHVRLDRDEPQAVHEAVRRRPVALDREGHHAAGALRKVFPGQGVVRVVRKVRIADPLHGGVVVQELRHLPRRLADVLHPDGEGLDAEVQVKGVLGALDGAQVAHQLAGGLGDVGQFSEFLRIGEPVIGLVRGRQPGELLRVRLPVEVAAVDDGAADRGAVAVQVLRSGVRDDVGAELDGAAVHRRGERVVHDEGHPVGVGDAGEPLDVQHPDARIGQRLAEKQLGVRPEGSLDLFVGSVLVDEGHLDAHLRESDAEEVERAAVDGGRTDHMAAGLADVEAGEEVRGLPGGGQHSRHAAFEGRQARRHAVVGGVLETGIEIAGLFEVEETAHLVAGRVFEGRTLDDRHLPGLAVGRFVARLDTQGGGMELLFHTL